MIVPVSYLQTDARWSSIDYSAKGESTTIGKSGCGPSCMAMVLATFKDAGITPKDTCAWSLSHGYKAPNQGTYYSYFKPQGAAYEIEVEQINWSNIYGSSKASSYHEKALAAIKAGHLVICCMGKGNWTSSGHFILWYGVDGNQVLIRDPNSTKAARVKAALSLLQSQVKYYFIVKTAGMTAIGEEKDMDETTVRKLAQEEIKKALAGSRDTPSSWAEEGVEWAKESGLISDTKALDGSIDKEEVATIFHRMYKKFIGK